MAAPLLRAGRTTGRCADKTHVSLVRMSLETVDKAVDSPRWKGRVCAGNPRRVSRTIEIKYFQNLMKF